MATNHDTLDSEDQPLLATFSTSGMALHINRGPFSYITAEDQELATLSQDERRELERTLLKKLDRRMSLLVLIYILNCENDLLLKLEAT